MELKRLLESLLLLLSSRSPADDVSALAGLAVTVVEPNQRLNIGQSMQCVGVSEKEFASKLGLNFDQHGAGTGTWGNSEMPTLDDANFA